MVWGKGCFCGSQWYQAGHYWGWEAMEAAGYEAKEKWLVRVGRGNGRGW